MTGSEVSDIELKIILFQGKESWVAQCLDYDVAAQGRTVVDALEEFERVFVYQLILYLDVGKDPLEELQKAPEYYWRVFQSAEKLMSRPPTRRPLKAPPSWMVPSITRADLRIAKADPNRYN